MVSQLVGLSVRELNKRLHGIPKDEVKVDSQRFLKSSKHSSLPGGKVEAEEENAEEPRLRTELPQQAPDPEAGSGDQQQTAALHLGEAEDGAGEVQAGHGADEGETTRAHEAPC